MDHVHSGVAAGPPFCSSSPVIIKNAMEEALSISRKTRNICKLQPQAHD